MEFSLQYNRRAPQISVPPIDFRAELNDEQYAAVTAEPGPALVLAGAGSGKTRTLTFRVAYLLTKEVRPGEILLLTFTNKAAREMLQRVEELTGIPRYQFWGGTFHHVGQKILRIHGEEIGLGKNYTILDQGDAESFMAETIREINPGFLKNKTNPKPKVLAAIWSMARNTRLTAGESILRYHPQFEDIVPQILPFFEAYQRRKLQQQVADYDDLLEYLLLLLQKSAEVREYYQTRFRHLLVDEYQDTNRLQSEIVDLLGSHHRVMAVGDDAQCIYSWRGANFENIITFPERHPNTRIYKIETNYRSTPEILALANGVLVNQHDGIETFRKELRANRPSQSRRPFVTPTLDGIEQAQFVIRRIHGLMEEKPDLKLSDIVILYRAHFQSIDLQKELALSRIPFQITSGVRFFEQAHIRDLVAQIRFAYNPRDTTSFQRIAALLPKVGPKTATKLHKLATDFASKNNVPIWEGFLETSIQAKVPADAREEWPQLIYSLRDMAEAAGKRTPAEVVEIGMDGWYHGYLVGEYANFESRLDDLKSLVGFASRFEELQDLLAQLVLLNSETTDRSVDDDEDKLRLTTIHQAKGLEFPVVFLIGASDGLFPLRRTIEDGDLEEERRLFYVGVTRARDELYITYPMVSRSNGPAMALQPSRFIEEIPENRYEIIRLQRHRTW